MISITNKDTISYLNITELKTMSTYLWLEKEDCAGESWSYKILTYQSLRRLTPILTAFSFIESLTIWILTESSCRRLKESGLEFLRGQDWNPCGVRIEILTKSGLKSLRGQDWNTGQVRLYLTWSWLVMIVDWPTTIINMWWPCYKLTGQWLQWSQTWDGHNF